MPLDEKVLQDYLDTNWAQYRGKYRFHSGYRIGHNEFKFHYYMLDTNFRQIDIYLDVSFENKIAYTFSENLHEQEQTFIVKDVVKRILKQNDQKRLLHYSLYEKYIKHELDDTLVLEPMDFRDVLNYMKYHQGINQNTIDQFYGLLIPYLDNQIKHKEYKKFMDTMNLLLDVILYENYWDGINFQYLDTEYQYHLYFIRKIIRMVYRHLDQFYKEVPQELIQALKTLCMHTRFTLAIMTDFGKVLLSQYYSTKTIMERLEKEFILCDKDEEKENENLIFSYIYYIYHNNFDQYYEVVLKLLRMLINNMMTVANHDLDLALGNSLIKAEGYDILLDLFHRDYNTFIFTCFPIEEMPASMKLKVKDELVGAIQFFGARMENDNYRLSSFEQVMNINNLLMDNFKEWYLK